MALQATDTNNHTPISQILYMAIELSNTNWKLGFTIGFGQAPRLRSLRARDLKGLETEIKLAKERFGLPESAVVLSCYEAGRDGFYLHRYLKDQGVTNLVVDSASIEVNRRKRRAKTDHLDVGKLLTMLMRYQQGEKKVWSIVRVPSLEVEDRRQLHRELTVLKSERTHHINRIKGLLASQGITIWIRKDFLSRLDTIRLWDGSKLPDGLQTLLEREYERILLDEQHIRQLERLRNEALRTSKDPAIEQVRQLMRQKGIGINSAWLYVMEFFSWRNFRNRREVGCLAGLTPTPYQSGGSNHEQGISKAGNRPIRAMATEVACRLAPACRRFSRHERWAWLRFQPDSQLSLWYQRRFGGGSKRLRKIGIVALARKLLIALPGLSVQDRLAIPGDRHSAGRCLRGDSLSWDRFLNNCSSLTIYFWCEQPVFHAGFPIGDRSVDGVAP